MVTPESQVAFLTNLQRLLSEGTFVATYKYALLLSLADISVERGDDVGSELEVPSAWIAEKFVAYYWRQTAPFVPKSVNVEQAILLQNTGRQAAVVNKIAEARASLGHSLAGAKSNPHAWTPLIREVESTVRTMPLWKLQTVGSECFDFLYLNLGKGTSITLRPGVATCFRKFYGLIAAIVRGEWVQYVRRYNHGLLGTTTDLSEFMFGSERAALASVREALLSVSVNQCFYCDRSLSGPSVHVDHFIPWAKYPVDLGHNFVLTHAKCNSAKSNHIASVELLEKWIDRNLVLRDPLKEVFRMRGILHDLPTSARIAQWVYSTTANAGGMTWRASSMVPLEDRWQTAIDRLLSTAG